MLYTTEKFIAAGLALLAIPQLVAAVPATSSANPPLVNGKVLSKSVTESCLLRRAKELEAIAYSTPGRNRAAGTEGHNKTVAYVQKELKALGDYYDVEIQPWTGQVQASGNVTFTVNGKGYNSTVLEFSPSGKAKNVALVPVAKVGCDAADVPKEVKGAIALVSRGECPFAQKAENAKKAGAVATVVYNNEDGPVQGTYGGVLDTVNPGAGISKADGEALVKLVKAGSVKATIDIATDIQAVYSSNVIATSKFGDPDNILFIGAHSDSVAEGPGINDDGSGTLGILEVATKLAKYSTKSQVKFGWWTAEESGLLGSTAYVESLSEEELMKIRLYLNFDMIASPNFIYGHYDGDGSEFGEKGPAGSDVVEHFFEKYYESAGVNHTATEFNGRSDYGPFLEQGIPCGGLDAGADEIKTEEQVAMFGGTAGIILDPNYHQAGDNVANLNMTCFTTMTKGIASAVANFAGNGFKGFPAREAPPPEKRTVARSASKSPKRVNKYRFPVAI